MFNFHLIAFAAVLLTCWIPDAVSYSKYGRTCKDIGCRSDEVCIMMEDPCTGYAQDKCGRYPTCKKSHAGDVSCTSMVCSENNYCKVENGVPKCVSKITSNGYESAGVDIVNGQRVSSNDDNTHTNTHTSFNPYANANAPPAPFPDPVSGGTGYHQVNSGTSNLGYPAYPGGSGGSGSSSSDINRNSGYPPYPSNSNQGNHQGTDNLGYPPYPTHNRMPMPGHAGYPPQQQYPNSGQRNPTGYQNYPNQNQRGYVYSSNPYLPSGPDSRQRYPVVRPTPPPVPPRRPSSGRAGSRNTVGDNSIWYRLFGGDRDQGSNGRNRPATNQQTGYYNTHSSTDSRGNRIWTFSG